MKQRINHITALEAIIKRDITAWCSIMGVLVAPLIVLLDTLAGAFASWFKVERNKVKLPAKPVRQALPYPGRDVVKDTTRVQGRVNALKNTCNAMQGHASVGGPLKALLDKAKADLTKAEEELVATIAFNAGISDRHRAAIRDWEEAEAKAQADFEETEIKQWRATCDKLFREANPGMALESQLRPVWWAISNLSMRLKRHREAQGALDQLKKGLDLAKADLAKAQGWEARLVVWTAMIEKKVSKGIEVTGADLAARPTEQSYVEAWELIEEITSKMRAIEHYRDHFPVEEQDGSITMRPNGLKKLVGSWFGISWKVLGRVPEWKAQLEADKAAGQAEFLAKVDEWCDAMERRIIRNQVNQWAVDISERKLGSIEKLEDEERKARYLGLLSQMKAMVNAMAEGVTVEEVALTHNLPISKEMKQVFGRNKLTAKGAVNKIRKMTEAEKEASKAARKAAREQNAEARAQRIQEREEARMAMPELDLAQINMDRVPQYDGGVDGASWAQVYEAIMAGKPNYGNNRIGTIVQFGDDGKMRRPGKK